MTPKACGVIEPFVPKASPANVRRVSASSNCVSDGATTASGDAVAQTAANGVDDEVAAETNGEKHKRKLDPFHQLQHGNRGVHKHFAETSLRTLIADGGKRSRQTRS